MGNQAKMSGTKPTTDNASTWSPPMDGLPEPSRAEQVTMDARFTSYESRRLKAFQEIWPGSTYSSPSSNDVVEPSKRNGEATRSR
ncbi:hypothetical protein QQP08_002314 [Theobroma cacao]|nr:hypothetical protein QQP08_002314 [Theobroma cacao]